MSSPPSSSPAPEADASWADTQGILAELEVLSQETGDADKLRQCKAMVAEMRALYGESEADAKALIARFVQQVDESRRRAEDFAAQTPSSPEIEALEQERSALAARIAEAGADDKEANEMIAVLEKKIGDLETSLAATERGDASPIPLMSHSLTLYANVSKIKWLYPDPPSSKTIAGSVVNADSGVIKEFELDKSAQRSKFHTANQLWDIVNSCA